MKITLDGLGWKDQGGGIRSHENVKISFGLDNDFWVHIDMDGEEMCSVALFELQTVVDALEKEADNV